MIKSVYLISFLLVLSAFAANAQSRVPAFGGDNDNRQISFGFVFQYYNSDFNIIKKPNWRTPYYDTDLQRSTTDSLTSISSHSQPGFGVGFITRLNLNDHIELRTTPGLVFADRIVNYTYPNSTQNVERVVSSTSVDVPIGFKLKSDRIGDFRLYIMGNLRYSMAINKKANVQDIAPIERPLQMARNFSMYEAGVGCDIYFEYFKFSPELKISNSFNDVLMHEYTPYANPISQLFLHSIVFSIHFE